MDYALFPKEQEFPVPKLRTQFCIREYTVLGSLHYLPYCILACFYTTCDKNTLTTIQIQTDSNDAVWCGSDLMRLSSEAENIQLSDEIWALEMQVGQLQ